MIKKLIPVFVAISGAIVLTLLINKYLMKLDMDISAKKDKNESSEEKAEPDAGKSFAEKRRPGYEDRRKELRDLAMSRPRRKDEMIH